MLRSGRKGPDIIVKGIEKSKNVSNLKYVFIMVNRLE